MKSEQKEIETNAFGGGSAPTASADATVGAAPTEPATAVVPEVPTAEELADLRANAAKAAENWDRYVRAVADLENFRKRAAREKQDALRYANEALMTRLIPVLDNFEMALAAAGAVNASAESLKAGVVMISNQLKAALTEAGLEEVDANGQVFDPTWHEAVSEVESANVPEGQVVQQIRKGYKFRDRLLRAAAVVVARAPGATPAPAAS